MKELPFISIIIVNYNGKQFLADCFNSLQSLDYPANRVETILVDNNSVDDSLEFIANNYPRVKTIKLDANYGFCKPNNKGVAIAKGEYVVFLNNDTQVTSSWLMELVKAAIADDRITCCASKILYYERRNVINAAGGKITIVGGGVYSGYGENDSATYQKPGSTGFGCGAGVLVKKEFYEFIGGFDEMYFASCEENDLGWKSWLFGYKVMYVPSAIMYHHESGTFGSRSTFEATKVYYITRNRLYNLLKNLEMPTLLKAMIISSGFNFYRGMKFLLSGNFNAINAIIKAHFSFICNIKKILPKRQFVKKNRVLSDSELYRLGVIATLRESVKEEIRINKLSKSQFYKI